MHPYEMATLLRERGKERDIKIKWGSLYTVVQNLEKHGFIEAAGHRPARSPAGADRLRDHRPPAGTELRGLAARAGRRARGRSFRGSRRPCRCSACCRPTRSIELLRQRVDALDGGHRRPARDARWQSGRRGAAAVPDRDRVRAGACARPRPPGSGRCSTELTEGTMPGMADWRRYHETGRDPAGVPGSAQRGRTADRLDQTNSDPGAVRQHRAGAGTRNRTRGNGTWP